MYLIGPLPFAEWSFTKQIGQNNVNFHFSVFVQHQQQKEDHVVCLGEFKDVSSHMD